MGEKGEGSGGEGGGKWGERGRELGMGYPPVHPLTMNEIKWPNHLQTHNSVVYIFFIDNCRRHQNMSIK